MQAQQQPAGALRWSCRSMASECPTLVSTVGEAWQDLTWPPFQRSQYGLALHATTGACLYLTLQALAPKIVALCCLGGAQRAEPCPGAVRSNIARGLEAVLVNAATFLQAPLHLLEGKGQVSNSRMSAEGYRVQPVMQARHWLRA